jgi:hypothetical protein
MLQWKQEGHRFIYELTDNVKLVLDTQLGRGFWLVLNVRAGLISMRIPVEVDHQVLNPSINRAEVEAISAVLVGRGRQCLFTQHATNGEEITRMRVGLERRTDFQEEIIRGIKALE